MANKTTLNENSFAVGDIVRVFQKVTEKEKEKESVFEGRVIGIKGRGNSKTFTVRKVGADNVGVERIFPLFSPTISKVEVKKSIPVRRAKLYYLRDKINQ